MNPNDSGHPKIVVLGDSLSAGFGLFVGLIAALVSTVAGFLSFRSTQQVKTTD